MKSFLCLHGFLGSTRDWDFLRVSQTQKIYAPTLHNSLALKEADNWKAWSKEFRADLLKETDGEPCIGIGYSLGARLLAEMAIEENIFSELHLLSWNPGLLHEEEKTLRLDSDKRWAEKLLSEPWDTFLKDWNSQAAFYGSEILKREEPSEEEKCRLAQMLNIFSLGLQKNQWQILEDKKIPFICYLGERDEKLIAQYLKLGISLKENSRLRMLGGGHRLLLDAPDALIPFLTSPLA